VVPELRPRSVGEVLDSAVLLYRARFGALMRVAIAILVPVAILTTLVLLSALPDDFTVGFNGEATPVYNSDTNSAVQLGAILVTTLLSALATAFVTAATTRIVADAYVGHQASPVEAARLTGRRLVPIIVLTIIVTAATIAGYFLCFVPGFWIQTAWCVALPVLILEATGVSRALGRSFELTKARFWLAFGVFWIGQALVFVLRVGFAALVAIVIIRGSHSNSGDVIAQSLGSAIASIITVPFAATALVALYFDLRIRAEALDVQMAIASLDEPRVPGSLPA
jgi:hypothetical protein